MAGIMPEMMTVVNNSNFFSAPIGYLSHDPDQKGIVWSPKSILVVCGYIVFISVTVVGNVIVLVTFAFTTNHKTVYNLYYINLSLSDLMVGALAMPLMLMQDLLGYWPLGVVMCDIWAMMDGIFSSTSFLTLAAVAWERYCAVAKISLTSYQQSLQRASIIIAMIWLVSLAVWIPRQYVQRAQLNWELANDKCHDLELPAHVLACAVVMFYIPMIFMIVTYVRLYSRLNEHLRQPRQWSIQTRTPLRPQQSFDSDNHTEEHIMLDEHSNFPTPTHRQSTNGDCNMKLKLKEEKNHWEQRNVRMKHATARTLGCVMTAFLVCWVPYSVVWPIEAYQPELVSHIACDVVIWLAYVNSAINPWVYVYSNKDLRKAVKEVWCMQRRR